MITANGMLKEKLLVNVGNKDLQMEFVGTWIGAQLPIETQWKYAASGGKKSKQYKHAGSNDLEAVGWYKNNSGQQLHPVG